MRRVLVVDADLNRLHALEAVMRGAGFEPELAEQGTPALGMARRDPPALIIAALPLLVDERFTLLRHAKTTASLAAVAFIVVSPSDIDPRDEELALDVGADAVLRYPSDTTAFIARVQAVIARTDPGAERRNNGSTLPPSQGDTAGEDQVLLARLKKRVRLLERERAAAAEDGEHLRLALDAARMGTFVRDLKRQRVRWASGYKALWDGDPRALDEAVSELEAKVHPDDLPGLQQAMRHAIETHNEYEHEYRVLYANNNVRWIHGRGRPYYDELGAPDRVVGIYFEVTERKQLEQQVRQTQKMEAIGLLAGGIAHDFNNILGAIIGNEELMRRTLPAEHESISHLDEIGRASRRAKNLVQQILAFSRNQPVEKGVLAPASIVLETASLLRATLPATIELVTQCTPGAPNVVADATQLEQVLLNLGTNAWQAFGGGPGRIVMRLEDARITTEQAAGRARLMPGRYAHISVTDNGSGITEEILPRIFEPFFTTKPRGHGTGLGLAVVHEIVTDHHGVVWASSTVGLGTTFHVYLPATDRVERPAEPEAPPPATPRPAAATKRVLYIDDEPALARVMSRMLAPLGYQVEAFTDAGAALTRFAADVNRFDLAITDLTMPHASGMDIAQQLLSLRPGLPVLLLSGHITGDRREHARSLGIREVLPKPVTSRDLCAAIERALQPDR